MYVNCSGPGFALHSDIVMPYISHYGTEEQIDKFIPPDDGGDLHRSHRNDRAWSRQVWFGYHGY